MRTTISPIEAPASDSAISASGRLHADSRANQSSTCPATCCIERAGALHPQPSITTGSLSQRWIRGTSCRSTARRLIVSPGIIAGSRGGRAAWARLLSRALPEETHARVRAAIDVERLPGDELRAIAREKGDGRTDVARTSDAPPRYQRVAELGRVARHVEVARHLDDTRADCVHSHVPGRQLDGQRARKANDGAFGPGVGGMVWEASAAMNRGDVDDRAASGAFQRGQG